MVISGDDDREKDESDEYDVDAFQNPASDHEEHIDDHAEIEEIHDDALSGKGHYSLVAEKQGVREKLTTQIASDTILELDASIEPLEINHDYVYI